MKIFKKKGSKFDQSSYDSLFHNIENNLRELGFGDVYVNKKMKDMNKLLYDILLKIDEKDEEANNKEISRKIELLQEDINLLRKLYKYLFLQNKTTFKKRINSVEKNYFESRCCLKLLEFLNNSSNRSYCMPDETS